MKFLIVCVLLGLAANAYADDFSMEESEGRFLYFNTSSTATSLTLLGALILLGVIGYLVYAGGLLGSSSGYNRNDYYQDGQYYQGEYQQAYRSSDDGFDFNGTASIITWITRLQELYEKFDTNNIECHKRLICEVMKDPSYYGSVAQKAKVGFQYAKYLEVLSLPDEMRELLDEYLDANARSDAQKDCGEFYDCDYSIKDSFQKAVSGNGL